MIARRAQRRIEQRLRPDQPRLVATLGAGYADGITRRLSGIGTLWDGDTPVPILGRVSMDLVTIDLTPAPQAQVGDEVVLWGDGLAVEEVAASAGTISYELLTSIGARVERRYGEAG